MHSSGDFLSTPSLDYEAWRDVVRSICGRYTPGGIEPKTFFGKARVRSICGFRSVDLSSNARCLERTHQDVRVNARDHYYAIFQMTGQSRIIQNDRTVELTVGDVALVDAARPVTYVARDIRIREGGRTLGVFATAAPVTGVSSRLGTTVPYSRWWSGCSATAPSTPSG